MKTQLKRLNRISKIECLNPGNYYCITFHENDIKLQGKFKGELSAQLCKIFGIGKVDPVNGYVTFLKHNIDITLTD